MWRTIPTSSDQPRVATAANWTSSSAVQASLSEVHMAAKTISIAETDGPLQQMPARRHGHTCWQVNAAKAVDFVCASCYLCANGGYIRQQSDI